VEGAIRRLKELRGDGPTALDNRPTTLFNSSFEKGALTHWTTTHAIGVSWLVSKGKARNRSFSATYDNLTSHRRVGGSTDQVSISQTTGFHGGRPYTVSYFANGSPGFTQTLKVEWLDASMHVIATSASTILSAETWSLHEMTEDSPAGTIWARVIIEVEDTGEPSAGIIYFDDIWLAGATRLENEGFEQGILAPWTTTRDAGVTWSIGSNAVHGGSFSLEYDNALWSDAPDRASISQTLNFNSSVYFTASYVANGRSGFTLTLRIEWLDISNNVIATEASAMASADGWNLHEIIGTSPPATVKARFVIEVADTGEPSAGTIYFDDALLMGSNGRDGG